ncbi:MAG: hypothetical protein IPI82_19560, partial [Candidatus Microthrix sp.]|nr:hypothetical protein [Candidatus Microthrix sp.]
DQEEYSRLRLTVRRSTSTEIGIETREPKEVIEAVEAFVTSKLTGLLG